jgi:pyruvate kinase
MQMTHTVDIEDVDQQLAAIRERALEYEQRYAEDIALVDARYRDSARNLLHYIALRKADIRELQQDLAVLGLSSLGRAERHVLASITAVQTALQHGAGSALTSPLAFRHPSADRNKTAILGEPDAERDVSIMVTMPTEAATDRALVVSILETGMNVARINCARDDKATWAGMVRNIRGATETVGKPCRIIMDLAGPKLRTGPLQEGPKVIHLRPKRGPMGRVNAPRRVRLVPDDVAWTGTKSAVLPVPRECVELAGKRDVIKFRDTRGRKRQMVVVEKDEKGAVAELYKGAYIATGGKLVLHRKKYGEKITYRVGELPAIERPLLLRPGDTLLLHRESIPGAPAIKDENGDVLEPAHISCRQPEVLDFVAEGHRVSMNDGKISGIVRSIHADHLELEIRKAKPAGSRLRADKGINFPDSDIRLPGLTVADKKSLEFVVEHADAVSLSFVRRPEDVGVLQEELERLGAAEIGIVLKIETTEAFRHLPRLLLTAMRHYPVAVMIARGDLAVEAGWGRLAELQEELLWICEAAQVPVIWATQVLEGKTKRGLPSRAEISDAAMSQRADCVMLNKGPHILSAIRMLDDILQRMQAHQYKKTPTLRRLRFGKDSATA